MTSWLRVFQESPFYPPDPVPLLSSWAILWVPLGAGIAVLRALRGRGLSEQRSRVKEVLEMDAVVPLLGPLMVYFVAMLIMGVWMIHDFLTGQVKDARAWMAEWQQTIGPSHLPGSFGTAYFLVMLSIAVGPSLLALPEAKALRTVAAIAIQSAMLPPAARVSGLDLVTLEGWLGGFLGEGTFLSAIAATTIHFASRFLVPWLAGSVVALLVVSVTGALSATRRRASGEGGGVAGAQGGDAVPAGGGGDAAQSSPERTKTASSRPLTRLTYEFDRTNLFHG
ncbi:MAG: hypothetical protein NYU90_04825 [Aigarchaeota archaeon]|nr:hypothetical protein [Candidatus Calditenuis fumarioli]